MGILWIGWNVNKADGADEEWLRPTLDTRRHESQSDLGIERQLET